MHRSFPYVLCYTGFDHAELCVDANISGNEMKNIRCSCSPNAKVYRSVLCSYDSRCGHVYAPPPTGIGDPALWEPTPSHPPFPYVDLETRGFAVFLCFLVCISVKVDSR